MRLRPRFNPAAFGLLLGVLAFPAISSAQFKRGDWHTAEYPGRDESMWMVIAEDLRTSFPRGGAPVTVKPFIQPVPHILDLKTLGLRRAVSLGAATANGIVVLTSDGSFRVRADGTVTPEPGGASASGAQAIVETHWLEMAAGEYAVIDGRLQRNGPGGPTPVEDFGRDGLPDDDVSAIALGPGGELYAATPMGIGILSVAGKWRHLTGHEGGLPVNDTTSISFASDGGMWVGTAVGAAYRSPSGDWSYRMGPRWMAGDKVLDVAAFDDGGAWILTAKSLTRVEPRRMTLREKAKIYDDITQARHVRHGAVTGCMFRDVDDLDSWYMADNDNDGLWTSIYLGAKCFEYAATGDPEAKRLARVHFDFMRRLATINGVPGFLARSIRPSDYDPASHEKYNYKGKGEWHESTVEPGWQWKGDTSSDELTGHFFAWGVYYDLVAKGDSAEEKRVEEIVRGVTNHLIDHNFTLCDVDGLPTRWAVYSPNLLRGDLLWSDEVGFNALAILAHLKVAIHVCGDEKFKTAYRELIDKHEYDVKAMFSKEMIPNNPYGGLNHSDDEMAWMEFYHLLQYPDDDPGLQSRYRYAAARSQRPEGPEKSPFFIVPFATALPKWAHMGDAVETLEKWPLDLRHWTVRNSHRDDVMLNPLPSRQRQPLLVTPLKIDERNPHKWNHDPFVSDEGNDGKTEEDGASWLLPYWMAVYHKLIIEEEA